MTLRRYLLGIAQGGRPIPHECEGELVAVGGGPWSVAFVNAVAGRSEGQLAAMRRAAARTAAVCADREVMPLSWPHLGRLVDAALARSVVTSTAARGIPHPMGWRARLPAALRRGRPSPRSLGKEVGALCAWLTRLRPSWAFPLADAARERTGCGDEGDPEIRKGMYPGEVLGFLRATAGGAVSFDERSSLRAALAFGAVLGSPVALVASLATAEVHVREDEATGAPALCVGFRPRRKGRKVVRRRLVDGTSRTAWSAGSSPLIAEVIIPWLLIAKARGLHYLFPRWTGGSTVGTAPVRIATLSAIVAEARNGAQWHDLRRGVERAMEVVHLLPRVGPLASLIPSAPVPMHVRNWIMLRSNKRELGSRSSYVRPVATTMWAATRCLHLVVEDSVGGVVVGAGALPQAPSHQEGGGEEHPSRTASSSRGSSTPNGSESSISNVSESVSRSPEARAPSDNSDASDSVASAARSVDCFGCGGHITRYRLATLCSDVECRRAMCRKCHPNLRVSVRCEEHRPDVGITPMADAWGDLAVEDPGWSGVRQDAWWHPTAPDPYVPALMLGISMAQGDAPNRSRRRRCRTATTAAFLTRRYRDGDRVPDGSQW